MTERLRAFGVLGSRDVRILRAGDGEGAQPSAARADRVDLLLHVADPSTDPPTVVRIAGEVVFGDFALNPGSEYRDGILRAALVTLDDDNVRHQFIAG